MSLVTQRIKCVSNIKRLERLRTPSKSQHTSMLIKSVTLVSPYDFKDLP